MFALVIPATSSTRQAYRGQGICEAHDVIFQDLQSRLRRTSASRLHHFVDRATSNSSAARLLMPR
jgi:hypothetical protein